MNRQSYSRKIGANPIIHNVNKKFFGGLLDTVKKGINRISEGFSSLFGSNRLPKSFRDTLEKHKDKTIVNIKVCREPLARAVGMFANLITAGTFNEVASKQGEAGFFHLFSILTLDDGTTLIYEKNERPVLQVSNKGPSDKAECVSVDANVQLGEFIGKSIKKMGEDKYIEYNPISNNCQDFLLNSLQASDLSNNELNQFVKQDVEELIEKTPSFSKILASKATGLGGKLREIWEELTARRGRVIRRI
jgi:hypothetical protein